MSLLIGKIEQNIAHIVNDLGCKIVRVALFGAGGGRTLQIMIEKEDGSSATIDDCEHVSRAVSVSLDVMDPISGRYNLEVSSAGIDRPLVKPEDFIRFCGSPIVVRTHTLKNDRKIFKGVLESATESGIKLSLHVPLSDGENSVELDYEEICGANIDGLKL